MNLVKLFFNRQRWWTTLLAFVAVIVMIGLGFWQVSRAQERRAFNERVAAQIKEPPVAITPAELQNGLGQKLTAMEYHAVSVTGQYDFANQVALRNQAFKDQIGVALLTPLVISGTQQAVLVNRGWIPFEDAAPNRWQKFDEPGVRQIRGVVRYSQARGEFGGMSDAPGKQQIWNLANIQRIQDQMPHPLLPVYIQETPEGGAQIGEGTPYTVVNVPTSATPLTITLPARDQVQVDLSEGSNTVYAIQWFSFAAMVGIGYPYLVWSRRNAKNNPHHSEADDKRTEIK